MARPKNLMVTNGGKVFSVSPGKFKEILSARALGQPFPATMGKEVGEVFANVATMTDADVMAMIATLTPPAPAPSATVDAAPATATV